MELEDLNQDERTALVGLMKLTVMSDGNVSEEELESVEDLVEAFGEDAYQRTLDAFEKRFNDVESFKGFLKTIGAGRQEARELIFGTVLEAAGAEAIEGREAELLDWLGRTWDVKIQIEDDEEAEGDEP
jgi:hypothetical protein